MPQPGARGSKRLPEMDNWQNARERMRSIESGISSLETEINKLNNADEPVQYDDTILRRRLADLRFEFDRHTHEEFTRIGEGSFSGILFQVAKTADNIVSISAGTVINGTNTLQVSGTTENIGTTDGLYALWIEVSYSAGYAAAYDSNLVYPVQDVAIFKKVIALVTVASTVITNVNMVHPGDEIINPRIAE